MTPTREQLEAARAYCAGYAGHTASATLRESVRVLLAATAQPTDEELADVEFNDAAIALEMRKVERRGGSTDDMRHAAMAEVQRQLRARREGRR